VLAACHWAPIETICQRIKDLSYGRSEKKNIAVAAWHASFG
jgi:hypothetical protein